MDKKNILTYEGLKKLEDELENLKVVRRKEVSQKIKEAREQGDLSENAEYDAAKDEQRDIEARIEEIEKILKNAEVVVEAEMVGRLLPLLVQNRLECRVLRGNSPRPEFLCIGSPVYLFVFFDPVYPPEGVIKRHAVCPQPVPHDLRIRHIGVSKWHRLHKMTKLDGVSSPPREAGTMWQRSRLRWQPQRQHRSWASAKSTLNPHSPVCFAQ